MPAGAAWFTFGEVCLAALVASRDEHSDHADLMAKRATAEAALTQSLDGSGAFADLVVNAGLGRSDAEVLAVALAVEVSPSLQPLLGLLQREPGPSRLSLGTVAAIFGPSHPGVRCLGPDGPLRRCAFVDVTVDGPWVEHRVVVQPTLVWSVLGDDSVDPSLPLGISAVESADAIGESLTVVTGADPTARRRAAAAATSGRRFVVTPLPETHEQWSAVVREATITGSGVIVELGDTLPPTGRRWIERSTHLAWSLSCTVDVALAELPRTTWTAVEATATEPTDEEWRAVLGDRARTHRLSLQQLEAVGTAHDAYGGDLDAAVRRLVSGRLQQLATRVRPRRTWDDLVLSTDRKAALRSIVDRYRLSSEVYDGWGFSAVPSRGVVGLFSGPSGTGKSMAAEVLAGVLGLDVFKLDLSSVVSKYIGETEKNLEQIFDAASAGNLLLFFDEADSLFGKRSEVRDARDRYANVEVSYLLQRIEVYDGLIVLATNYERNIDDAFLRRIHTRIAFELPDPEERRQIWERNLPATAPVDDVDTTWLAEHFELSGGSIRNASVHAAFEAAAEGGPITMVCAVRGVVRELRKVGRLLNARDLGPYADAMKGELGA